MAGHPSPPEYGNRPIEDRTVISSLGNWFILLSESREVYRTGRDALTEPEVRRLLTFTRSHRDDMLLRLAISTGIRREDLVGIRLEGVDAELGTVRFHEGKKNREHRVTVGGETLQALRRYVRSLPSGTRYLFPSHQKRAEHMDGKTAWNILDQTLKLAGLKPRPFHALRATCVKLCQKHGWTIEQVAEMTGDEIRTIQIHYSVPSFDEMDQVAKEKPLL